jgi:hypothetical protein
LANPAILGYFRILHNFARSNARHHQHFSLCGLLGPFPTLHQSEGMETRETIMPERRMNTYFPRLSSTPFHYKTKRQN